METGICYEKTTLQNSHFVYLKVIPYGANRPI